MIAIGFILSLVSYFILTQQFTWSTLGWMLAGLTLMFYKPILEIYKAINERK